MGLLPLKKRHERDGLSLSLSLAYEDSKKVGVSKSGRRLLADTKSTGTLTLDFPDSRIVRTKCVLFKPPSLQYFVIAA